MVNLEPSSTYVLVVTRRENQMEELILLLVFASFGFALYLIVKEGLCEQLSQIDRINTRINAHVQRKENK